MTLLLSIIAVGGFYYLLFKGARKLDNWANDDPNGEESNERLGKAINELTNKK